MNVDLNKFGGIDPYSCSIEELQNKIKEYEQNMELENDLQMAVKIFINGIYGGMGCEYYKCYNPSLAEATTIQGQNLIKFATNIIDDYISNIWHKDIESHIKIANIMKSKFSNFDVDKFLENAKKKIDLPFSKNANMYTLACGGDTDSSYISFNPLLISCNIPDEIGSEFIMACNEAFLSTYLKNKFEEYAKAYNCDENLEEFELEKIARTVIYIAKKNYVMDIAWKEPNVYLQPLEKPIFSGLEVVKGSTPPWCRDRMKEFIIWLLDKCNKNQYPKYSEIIAKLKEMKKLFGMQHPDDICKSISISNYEKFILDDKKSIKLNDAIKTVPQHVLAAARYNNMLYTTHKKYLKKYNIIHGGDKVKLYYIDKDNAFVYLPYQYPIEFAPKFDIDTNFEKQMLAPLNRIITTCGYNEVPASLTYSNSLW